MPRLKLHQIALALAVSAALTACGEKTAQTTETPQAASAASGADAAASTAAVSAPQNSADVSAEDKALLERAQATFKPLPDLAEMQKVRPFTEEQVKLGQQLWYENRLSKGNTVSCNSCHNLATAGVDNMPTSAGHKSQFGGRNSPTALNAALLGSQFWDGRAADVEEQAGGPLLNPVEMANATEADAAAKIAGIPEYQEKLGIRI